MNIIEQEHTYIFQTYARYDLVLVKGKGKYVWDDKGRKYLDLFAGLSVDNVGHCHPAVVKAVKEQAGRLMHVSNLYYTGPMVRLARELVKRTFPGKVFFSNSGAEANECAIKLVRKWFKNSKRTAHRYEIISFNNSFHGRTLATLSATAQGKFHAGFEPMLGGFRYAEFNDIASVRKLVNRNTAAVIVEPVQGEGGVNTATPEFLKALRTLCDRHGLLLIFDEIQTGLGRTGSLFAFQQYGVEPDILTMAKSLGGGLPIGATLARERYADAFGFGGHGSTFGGNPVACAAACATLDVMTPALLRQAAGTGRYFLGKLGGLKEKHHSVREVRGLGLMLGMELLFPAREVVEMCMSKGLLINFTQGRILRFLPPLLIDRKDVDAAVRILDKALSDFEKKH